jgi:hypothetical protein
LNDHKGQDPNHYLPIPACQTAPGIPIVVSGYRDFSLHYHKKHDLMVRVSSILIIATLFFNFVGASSFKRLRIQFALVKAFGNCLKFKLSHFNSGRGRVFITGRLNVIYVFICSGDAAPSCILNVYRF